MHQQDFFVIQGFYETESGDTEEIYCGMKRRQKKQFKRNKKEYTRLSDHIGFIPLVMVSPSDSELISGGSEERRRFMDVVISQYDKEYLEALIRYNKALQQRNTLLKNEQGFDEELMGVWEEMMAASGEVVYRKRCAFIEEFIPIFQTFYSQISQNKEEVGLVYESHAQQGNLVQLLKESRQRDQIMGYSLKGIHKDDLLMQLGDYPIKKEGSQGQNKTYLIALKLAQFDFLRRTGSHTTPLLLLDDIFDKLDASRVENIISMVSNSDNFGQIFITDTNRTHLDEIVKYVGSDYRIFMVNSAVVQSLPNEDKEDDL
jgi:DNA replication and repair protein RecF